MSDEDKDSKTEDPTEKKLSDTLEKGNVPFSKEVTNAASLLGLVFVSSLFIPLMVEEIGGSLKVIFANLHNWPIDKPEDAASLINLLGVSIALALAPVILPMMVFGLVSSFSQNKPSMNLNRISPKISKISPMKGLKRLFGKQGVREFAKALFKFTAAGSISAFVAFSQVDSVVSQLQIDPAKIPGSIHGLVVRILVGLTLAITVLAAMDFVWVRKDWFDDIKMSHQEVKDERKQSEGDPLVKMKNRSIARDRSRRNMIKSVETATFVVANPTHFSVALRFDPAVDNAPFVLAKGQDLIALKIREVAEQNGVPITENVQLARALYKIVKLEQEVPPEFFVPLANIIRSLSDTNTTGQR